MWISPPPSHCEHFFFSIQTTHKSALRCESSTLSRSEWGKIRKKNHFRFMLCLLTKLSWNDEKRELFNLFSVVPFCTKFTCARRWSMNFFPHNFPIQVENLTVGKKMLSHFVNRVVMIHTQPLFLTSFLSLVQIPRRRSLEKQEKKIVEHFYRTKTCRISHNTDKKCGNL